MENNNETVNVETPAPETPAQPTPAVATNTAEQPQKKPFYKRAIFWLVVGGSALVGVGAALLFCAKKGSVEAVGDVVDAATDAVA